MRDLDLGVTALARPSGTCTSELQTCPLVREGAPYKKKGMSEGNFRRKEGKII
jgi:hypothetical protein